MVDIEKLELAARNEVSRTKIVRSSFRACIILFPCAIHEYIRMTNRVSPSLEKKYTLRTSVCLCMYYLIFEESKCQRKHRSKEKDFLDN